MGQTQSYTNTQMIHIVLSQFAAPVLALLAVGLGVIICQNSKTAESSKLLASGDHVTRLTSWSYSSSVHCKMHLKATGSRDLVVITRLLQRTIVKLCDLNNDSSFGVKTLSRLTILIHVQNT